MYSVCDPFFGKGNTGNRTLLNRSAAHNKAKSSSKIIKIPQLNVGFSEMRCPNVSEKKKYGMVFCDRKHRGEGSQRHSQSAPKGLERDSCHADSEPTEVCRAGVLVKS